MDISGKCPRATPVWRVGPSDTEASKHVARALRALNGRATRGDLIMATALPRTVVEEALDSLMAAERVQVAVSESAVLTYRLEDRASASDTRIAGSGRELVGGPHPHPFDRKTLQLIRARGGVISLAELVEHTGLTVERAAEEAERLSDLYGGEPHVSWDEHVVYAFPELVESAHGDFHVREPRPSWARADDPMAAGDHGTSPDRRLVAWLTAASAGVLAWLITFPPGAEGRALVLAAVAGISAGGAFAVTSRAAKAIMRLPRLRLHDTETLRRYVLGLVFETALRGKGVVSLDRAVAYLRARSGGRAIRRGKVEVALRRLAAEFDATITEEGGDLFFGFRNVKRQFLASHVQRLRLRLERQAAGRTVFDSGDSEVAAAARELEEFDRLLLEDRRS